MIKNLLFTFSCIILGVNISNGQNEIRYANTVASQSNLGYIAGKYFRSNPYIGTFSSFINHLVNDPTLTDKEEVKKTDSTLYSFTGFYTKHHPFAFKTGKMQVSLWEESMLLNDTLSLRDTVVNYLLSAHLPYTEANEKMVKKEVAHIYNRNKRYFSETRKIDMKNKKGEINGGGYNMFLLMHGIAPFATLWQIDEKKKEISLHLLFRISNSNNQSESPLPLFPRY